MRHTRSNCSAADTVYVGLQTAALFSAEFDDQNVLRKRLVADCACSIKRVSKQGSVVEHSAETFCFESFEHCEGARSIWLAFLASFAPSPSSSRPLSPLLHLLDLVDDLAHRRQLLLAQRREVLTG